MDGYIKQYKDPFNLQRKDVKHMYKYRYKYKYGPMVQQSLIMQKESVDYPKAEWIPANQNNYTKANRPIEFLTDKFLQLSSIILIHCLNKISVNPRLYGTNRLKDGLVDLIFLFC
jgi:hypothetical protein